MAHHKYKVGDIVEVFSDPFTKLLSEGKAKIVCLTHEPDYYKVIFADDPEMEVGRFIY